MAIDTVLNPVGMARKLSVPQLQQAIQNGTIPPYVGIPVLQEKIAGEQRLRGAAAMQGQPKQPPIAQQVMAEASGLDKLQSNLPTEYAGGGIVAFASGGSLAKMLLADDEEADDDYIDSVTDAMAKMDAMREKISELGAQEARGSIDVGSEEMAAPYVAAKKTSEGVTVKEGDQPARTVEREKQTVVEPKGIDELLAMIQQKESGGRRYGKDGRLLTSPKGAMGEMQVMPGTARDPGFGLRPAREGDPEDLARLGKEYYTKMLERYGDPKIAAIAYNWGPGNTDKWLSAGADPSKLPGETRQYAQGFAEGGIASFRNGGSFAGDEDYLTIPGLELDDSYARAMRRAKGIPEPKQLGYRPGKMPPDFGMRIAGEDLYTVENLEPGTLFADATRSTQSQPAQPAQAAQSTRAQLAPINPNRNNPMSVTGPGDPRWGRDLGRDRINPDGPAATPNMMSRIETLGAQLDQARTEVDVLTKARPGLRQRAADPEWQQKYDEAVARKNSLQNQYEKLMESTGMNQAAFGVFGGALSPTQRAPNPMVQAMGAQQPPLKSAPVSSSKKEVVPPDFSDSDAAERADRMTGITSLVSPEFADNDAAERADRMTGKIATESVAKDAEEPKESESMTKLRERITKGYEKLDKQEAIDNYLAILSAGLGMMGGSSPFASVNIGKGALQGVQSYLQSGASRAAQEKALMSAELGTERYGQLGQLQREQMLMRKQIADAERERKEEATRAAMEGKGAALAERQRQSDEKFLGQLESEANRIVESSGKLAALENIGKGADEIARAKKKMVDDLLAGNKRYVAIYNRLYPGVMESFGSSKVREYDPKTGTLK